MTILKSLTAALGGLLIACGVASAADTASPSIIGGGVAPAGKWPFMVAVEFKDGTEYYQDCGGSLIAKDWVLTAAHCVMNDRGKQVQFPNNTRVMIGSNDLTVGGRRIQAAKVIPHPKYDAFATDYDVALIKLSKAVTDIKPVAYIASTTTEASYAMTGTTTWVIGWGDTDRSSRDVYPDKLYEVSVPIVARSVCNGPKSYDGDITTRMFCAGVMAGGKDSCQGDSGGPLLVADASGAFRLQAGVVSFGYGCAVKNYPGVYSRLAVLGPWITQTIKTQ